MVAFVLNTAHRLPPIPTQNFNNLQQSAVMSHHAIFAFFRLLQQVKLKGLFCENAGPDI